MNTHRRIESLEDLIELGSGYAPARALQVAALLDLFTHLSDGPLSVEALAERTQAPGDALERLLTVCCALGLLTRDGEVFANTPVSDAYLVRGRELYQGNALRHGMDAWERWGALARDFRPERGEGPWGEPDDFILAMHNMTMAGRGEALARTVDLRGRRRLLDVGGGPGTYSVYLCRANPELRATVWDLPGAIAIARRLIAGQPDVRERIECVEGDWNTDEFGEGYDCLLMSNVVHGRESQAEMKFAKAQRALTAGGLMIVQDFILNDARDGPLPAALFNMYIGAFTFGELRGLLEAAGFEDVRVVRRPAREMNSVMTAVRA
ncbi:MAG: methyltransferase [Armatimonadota bacterium]